MDTPLTLSRAAMLRAPAHAGTSYAADAAMLRRQLDAFFVGVPRPRRSRPLAALIAPHVDLRVGGRAYGHAYAAVAAAPAERFVILGTAHGADARLFAATRQDFATPLGVAATDRAFLERLGRRAPEDLFAGEHLHRAEHAIEFQVVLLQHVLGRRPFTIVPILVTSLHAHVSRGRAPSRDPRVTGFVEALRATLADDAAPTTIVAAVDLAHIGSRYGDREGLAPALVAAAETKDRLLVAALERGDPEGFFATLAADADRTRICGAAPLCTLLALAPGRRGRLLAYDRMRDDVTRSSVSWASLAFDA
jgi:AmmeMemoRadiSam system protein B